MKNPKTPTLYVYYYRDPSGFYFSSGMSLKFDSVRELKEYYNKTSQYPVKFIKM